MATEKFSPSGATPVVLEGTSETKSVGAPPPPPPPPPEPAGWRKSKKNGWPVGLVDDATTVLQLLITVGTVGCAVHVVRSVEK